MSEQARVLYEGRFLRLCRDGRWEYAQRVGATGSVHIVAITPDSELLLVEQYRAPVAAPVIELPAGIVGDEAEFRGETVESAAARELVEETGYRPARVERLHHGPSTPGMASEVFTLVRAFDLERVGDGGGVGSEDIAVRRVPLAEAPAWLAGQSADGRMVDHRIYVGLYFLSRSGQA